MCVYARGCVYVFHFWPFFFILKYDTRGFQFPDSLQLFLVICCRGLVCWQRENIATETPFRWTVAVFAQRARKKEIIEKK